MSNRSWLVPLCTLLALGWYNALAAQDTALAHAVAGTQVTLERGLAASAGHGKPISAKFEMEDGHLQVSVYTATGGKFSEVVVSTTTGKVEKAEGITEGEDYTAATDQNSAMSKASLSLRSAVQRALRENAGFRAVSVFPSIKDGRPVAAITLARGDELKTVSVPLQSR